MKLPLDQNLSFRLLEKLEPAYPDSTQSSLSAEVVCALMLDIRLCRDPGVPPDHACDFSAKLTLDGSPHHARSEKQAKGIVLDYGMSRGTCSTKHFAGRIRLDTEHGPRKQKHQQFMLLIREVIHEDHG